MNCDYVNVNEPAVPTTATIACADWQVDPPKRVDIREASKGCRLSLMTIMIVPRRTPRLPIRRKTCFEIAEPIPVMKGWAC